MKSKQIDIQMVSSQISELLKNLMENQSIVISFYIEDPPYLKPNGISQELQNRIHNRVKMKYVIEPTSSDDRFHDCPYDSL